MASGAPADRAAGIKDVVDKIRTHMDKAQFAQFTALLRTFKSAKTQSNVSSAASSFATSVVAMLGSQPALLRELGAVLPAAVGVALERAMAPSLPSKASAQPAASMAGHPAAPAPLARKISGGAVAAATAYGGGGGASGVSGGGGGGAGALALGRASSRDDVVVVRDDDDDVVVLDGPVRAPRHMDLFGAPLKRFKTGDKKS